MLALSLSLRQGFGIPSENGNVKLEKPQISNELALDLLFCSMLVLNPQSGDSSDTSLGVCSVALLQVAKCSPSLRGTLL